MKALEISPSSEEKHLTDFSVDEIKEFMRSDVDRFAKLEYPNSPLSPYMAAIFPLSLELGRNLTKEERELCEALYKEL